MINILIQATISFKRISARMKQKWLIWHRPPREKTTCIHNNDALESHGGWVHFL